MSRCDGSRHPFRLLGSVVALGLLAGCGEESSRFADAPEVTLGEPVQGELTTDSAINLNDGSRYSSHWLCAEQDDGPVFYELEAAFPARLSLFDEEGSWLGGAGPRAGTAPAALLESADGACSLLVVSSSDETGFGPYRLSADARAAAGGETLTFDQSRHGRLGAEHEAADYRFSVDDPVHLALTLTSGEPIEMRLTGEEIAQRAESCGSGQSRLEAYLEPGDYRVRLAPGRAAQAGANDCARQVLGAGDGYRLSAERRTLPEGVRNGGPIGDGDTLAGLLEPGDRNAYRLRLDRATEVMLDLGSRDFDTLLNLSGPGIDLSDDDGGRDTDSRLSAVLVPGDYRIEVAAYGEGGGEYRLRMTGQELEGDFRNAGELAPGERLRGMLQPLQDNRYTLEVETTSEVRLALDSTQFDPVLQLHGNGVALSDDDGGEDRNSLIHSVLEPGRYDLEVQSYQGTGLYELSAELQSFDGELRDGGEVSVGDVVFGELPSGGRLVYRLVVDERRPVRIETASLAVDTVLTLEGGALHREDDDGGAGTGSRISEVLAPGVYDIEVRGFGDGAGLVRLELADEA